MLTIKKLLLKLLINLKSTTESSPSKLLLEEELEETITTAEEDLEIDLETDLEIEELEEEDNPTTLQEEEILPTMQMQTKNVNLLQPCSMSPTFLSLSMTNVLEKSSLDTKSRTLTLQSEETEEAKDSDSSILLPQKNNKKLSNSMDKKLKEDLSPSKLQTRLNQKNNLQQPQPTQPNE